jgi:dehydrogenase/reductase SDR family protein 1
MPAALVTGASRGVGRGVATALASAGFTVYATGRSIAHADLPPSVIRITADHLSDADTAAAFERVAADTSTLDILVNASWGGYERMVENGVFTWALPFWEQPLHRWTSMMDAGVRAAFVASGHAARMMIPSGRGLIANISHWAAQKHIGNALYGASKAATDTLTRDMAHELRPHGIVVASIYPGLVRTELVLQAAQGGWFDLSNSESPEFTGRVIAALAADAEAHQYSGRVIVAAEYAARSGVIDVDGRRPAPLSLQSV